MKPACLVISCGTAVTLLSFADFELLDLSVAHAQGSDGACSTTPCHVTNAFNQDLADLLDKKNQQLADAAKAAAESVKDSKGKDSGCNPPPVTLTVFTTPNPTDPKLETLIASARMAALVKYFGENGVPWQSIDPVYAPATVPNGAGSDGTVDMRLNNVDRDPPILKTNSKPPKGTKVKGGDQIKVHATASERFVDGHKSSPTGVKAIQLIADGTVVDSKDYGMKPPPCEVRIFEPSYTVPSNPPPVVHLLVIAEDAVGHRTFEEADFPTADWYGTLKGHGQGNIYNDTAEVRFSFSETSNGAIKGKGRVTTTSENQSHADCVTSRMPPKPYDIEIGGQRVGDEFNIELSNPRKTVTFSSKCKSGMSNTFSTETSGFLGAGSQSFLQPKVVAKDGATNVLPQTPGFWPVDATIELRKAKP